MEPSSTPASAPTSGARCGEGHAGQRREKSPPLTSLFAHHPLHYKYALTRSRCPSLDDGYQTLEDQLRVERQCLQCYSEMLPALAPHPSYLPLQDPPPSSSTPNKEQQQQQQTRDALAADRDMDEDSMPIEDKDFLWSRASRRVELQRSRHIAFLGKRLEVPFSANMMELAASRPWLIYWMVHGLSLLDAFPRDTHADSILATLDVCWDKAGGGGWGGGAGQQAHLACTYAAAATLVEAGLVERWLEGEEGSSRREAVYKILLSLKSENGGFMLHKDGEVDIRGAYCAIATASMLHMLTEELTDGLAEYVASCQGYDGGIAGERGLESHGGYTYCGLAALCITGQAGALDLESLLHWAACKQLGFEGGFQGRTAKLVDSCYSFWLGAVFPLVAEALRQLRRDYPVTHCWMSSQHLQQYILCCCQAPKGGIEDKPGKGADLYHTCYALSGMSIAQHAAAQGEFGKPPFVFGRRASNLLESTCPFYNVCSKNVEASRAYLLKISPFEAPESKQRGHEGRGPTLHAAWVAKFPRFSPAGDDGEGAEWADPESEAESM
ncbi:protein farnesyltransferase subunit beta [Cyclospora cayetanensis]|uniref:Protein farnesyltransferase subunit beta n=1 Tax=Cyclospora cayetanensis TaxID=88456 RepID=A0A6P6RXW3_9EIME|nr:protein farnesyltransferase subunit beta [Cyclospora cayetanensis]